VIGLLDEEAAAADIALSACSARADLRPDASDHTGKFRCVGAGGTEHGYTRVQPYVVPSAVAILLAVLPSSHRQCKRIGHLFGTVSWSG